MMNYEELNFSFIEFIVHIMKRAYLDHTAKEIMFSARKLMEK
jgi:hypothetical protein